MLEVVTRSTATVARPAPSITVRNTGFIERKASASLPAPVPALARFEAVVLRRTSSADMAPPLMSNIERLAATARRPCSRAAARISRLPGQKGGGGKRGHHG